MERLTIREKAVSGRDVNKLLEPSNENQFGITEAYFKLKEYEDAEEQGLLYKLPFKIGDTLWEVNKRFNAVYPKIVDSIVICQNSLWIKVGCGDSYEYGVEVFETKEEAEKALERMR